MDTERARLVFAGVPVILLLVGGLAWSIVGQRPATRAAVVPLPIPAGDPLLAGPTMPEDFVALASSQLLVGDGAGSTANLAFDSFGYYRPSDFGVPPELRVPTGEWTNKSELWDALAPRFRAEVVPLGRPVPVAPWPKQGSAAAGAPVVWSDRTTGGRGELVEFFAFYEPAPGRVALRVWPVLIKTLTDGSGRVAAAAPALEIPVPGSDDGARAQQDLAGREWAWVMSQPPAT